MRKLTQHKPNDLSRSLAALDMDSTLIAVIEMSQSSWLVAGIVPGIERQPLKKLAPDEHALLALLQRWRGEAERRGAQSRASLSPSRPAATASGWRAGCGRTASRRTSSMPTSVAVSREHRRAKTDRLDTELLEARLPRLAARRARPLQDGGDPDACGGGRQAPEPRAGEPGRRAHPHRQPDEGGAGAARHPRLQSEVEEGGGASRTTAHARGRADPTQHAGRAAARHGAPAARSRPDRRDRAGAPGASGAGARQGAERHGAPAGARDRHRHRDGRHAGAGGAVAQPARSPGGGALCRADRLRRTRAAPGGARRGSPDPATRGCAVA